MSIKRLALAAVIASLCASSAFAHAPKDRPYVGVDLQANRLPYKSNPPETFELVDQFKKNQGGISLFGGYRWKEFGAELGYTYMGKHTKTVTGTDGLGRSIKVSGKLQNSNLYLDGHYYHAITSDFDLKALVGVGFLRTKFDGSVVVNGVTVEPGTGKESTNKAGIRVGLGGEYYFTDSFSSLLMFKYQTGNKAYKSLQTVSLGFAYHF